MKKLIVSLLAATALISVPAQTVAPSMPGTNATANAQTFLESIQGYFSTFDTNSTTFGKTNEIDLWTGYDYVNNVNSSSSLGFEYTLWKGIGAEAVMRNAGIAGTLLTLQGGFNVSKRIYDTKLSAFVDVGEDFAQKGMFVAFGARVKKALTANTFAGTGLEFHVGRQTSPVPTLSIFAGFTM